MSEEALESQRTQMKSSINMHSMKIEELQKENQALRKQVSELQIQLIKFLGDKCVAEGTDAQE